MPASWLYCFHGHYSRYVGEPFATTANYPDDLDTTSVALMQRRADPAVADSIMDEMLSLRSEDGIIMVSCTRLRKAFTDCFPDIL